MTLPDPSISRQHAKLMLRHGQVRLRDLNSSNGTYVNDSRVVSEADVVDGDRIVLGETEMRFHAAAPEGGAATEPAADSDPPSQAEDPPTLRRIPEGISPLSRETSASRPAMREESRPAAAAPAAKSAAPSPSGELLPSLQALDSPPAPRPARPRAAAPNPAAATLRPAGFWIRALATLIDGVWIGALSGLAMLLPFLLDVPASLASALSAGLGLVGFAVIVAGWAKWGTTPGKRLLGLYVCPLGGSPGTGFGRAILRAVGYLVSGALLGVGFLLVAFSKDKRGLHDLIAGTAVGRR